MAVTPGTRLGVYEVTAQIGVGGMGAMGEAHILASLNHPHIAAIYGLEEGQAGTGWRNSGRAGPARPASRTDDHDVDKMFLL